MYTLQQLNLKTYYIYNRTAEKAQVSAPTAIITRNGGRPSWGLNGRCLDDGLRSLATGMGP